MIDLADRLDGFLELLIVGRPAAYLGHLRAAQTDLPRAPAGIADGEHRQRMAIAAGASRTAAAMSEDPLDERASQKLTRDGQSIQQRLASCDDGFPFHLYK